MENTAPAFTIEQNKNRPAWRDLLAEEKASPYFQNILQFIEAERLKRKIIYPANPDIFNAFQFTPFEELRVVILGQDPYHGPRQAHGLCFSVQAGVAFPPSLLNIFKELNSDLGLSTPKSGNLEKWARQGVLLLNTALSVEAGKANSHSAIGWERFTDFVVKQINEHAEGIVFLLWGSHAQKKGAAIDRRKHHVLMAPHPSPLSAHRGFMGCKHFSQTNKLHKQQGQAEIDWSLS